MAIMQEEQKKIVFEIEWLLHAGFFGRALLRHETEKIRLPYYTISDNSCDLRAVQF